MAQKKIGVKTLYISPLFNTDTGTKYVHVGSLPLRMSYLPDAVPYVNSPGGGEHFF